MSKKKIATIWLAGCSGCHMSLLDMDERLLEVVKLADIVKSPVVDGKELPEVDVAIIEGAIASDEHLEELIHIRKQAKILVALGDCAITGNVSGIRNRVSKEQALERAYLDSGVNLDGVLPDHPVLQKLEDRVRPLHEEVLVDYYIPGCPPSADKIFYVISELLQGREPKSEGKGEVRYG